MASQSISLKERIEERLFRPTSIQSIVLFRIVFGLLAFGHMIGNWIYYHLMVDLYNPDKFQFRYLGFEWLPSFHDPWMSIIFVTSGIAGLTIALGWKYKFSCWYLAITFTYIFLLEKATYLNHSYLYAWICFLMPFIPADRAFSLRVRNRPEDKLTHLPFWPLFLMRFLMGVVYFYGGIAKINPDWMRGIPLKEWMLIRADRVFVGPIIEQAWVPWVMAYGGLFLDLFAAFLLINKRTRTWIFLFILSFHFINSLIFEIGIFPTLSITLSALFYPADFPGRVLNWLRERWKWLRLKTGEYKRSLVEANQKLYAEKLRHERSFVMYGLTVIVLFHCLIPFRHHLYPGHVAFTEEGHRYSWRMMLRQKSGGGYFNLYNPDNGKNERHYPSRHLWRKQNRKMYTHPDMIWQYAQHLKSIHQDSMPNIEVYANIRVRLNDHPVQIYIDPSVDLGSVDWSMIKHTPWICEQEEPMNWKETWKDVFGHDKN